MLTSSDSCMQAKDVFSSFAIESKSVNEREESTGDLFAMSPYVNFEGH